MLNQLRASKLPNLNVQSNAVFQRKTPDSNYNSIINNSNAKSVSDSDSDSESEDGKPLWDTPAEDGSYLFLEDLEQDLDISKYTGEITVELCVYKMNETCDDPFAEYLLVYDLEHASFPKLAFQIPAGPTDNIQTLFRNQCIEELLKIIPLHKTNQTELLESM